jgi:anaerobic ribonucleoside-triphosphate reductase activating protein
LTDGESVVNYANIKYCDIANGVGVRTSLFVSGCRLHCPGCFNAEAQDFGAGEPFTREVEDRIIESLRPDYIAGLTVLGGEPMEPENQQGLVDFLERVCDEFGITKTIWLYSGNTWDRFRPGGSRYLGEVTDRILETLDVLVDGPFVEAKHSVNLRFCGSSNQRLIDVPATLAADDGTVVLWTDDPVFSTHTM